MAYPLLFLFFKSRDRDGSPETQGLWAKGHGGSPFIVKEVATVKDVKRILVPVDMTQNAVKIIPFAVSFSEKLGSPITLLHVVQDLQKCQLAGH